MPDKKRSLNFGTWLTNRLPAVNGKGTISTKIKTMHPFQVFGTSSAGGCRAVKKYNQVKVKVAIAKAPATGGGEGGIRTHGTVLPVRRFSKPFLSATQAPLHFP